MNKIEAARRCVCLTITGERFCGTAAEIVNELRRTSLVPYETNEGFMRQWSYRARMFSKLPIIHFSEVEFVNSNIEAGLMKAEEWDN